MQETTLKSLEKQIDDLARVNNIRRHFVSRNEFNDLRSRVEIIEKQLGIAH